MHRVLGSVLAVVALAGAARAQQLEGPWLPPAQQVSMDATFGPMCQGPQGLAPCLAVRYFYAVDARARSIHLPVMGQGPEGPICNGPVGPGPCQQVHQFIAVLQVAQKIPLPEVGRDPNMGPICNGPLGPGPCDLVKVYLVNQILGAPPPSSVNLQQVQIVNPNGPAGVPVCAGPTGHVPCQLLQQQRIDGFGGDLPPRHSFGIPAGIQGPNQLAAACAQRTGLDVIAFSGCMGQQVVLPKNQQQVLDCAVSSKDTNTFAACAAPRLGVRLSDEQTKLAQCAMRSSGDPAGFTSCVGPAIAGRPLNATEQAALSCARSADGKAEKFAECAKGQFLTQSQSAAVNCAVNAKDAAGFAQCAIPHTNLPMSDDQRVLAKCALQSKGSESDFFTCAGAQFAGRNLNPDQRAVLGCAASGGGAQAFAQCAGTRLLGKNLSREQQVALQCAAESRGDGAAMAACAGANLFNLNLNPEQQIAVQCVVQTGGQPYAAAGCMATRLTARELTKCLTDGIGGKGCFGDSNDLVGRNGWTARTLGQIAGGPNSVINNPGQIWGGDNSFVRNPGQIWGGSNSFIRNPSQFWGGNNSVFNNPGQLLPRTPPPVQLGTVGGKRICLPWC